MNRIAQAFVILINVVKKPVAGNRWRTALSSKQEKGAPSNNVMVEIIVFTLKDIRPFAN